MSIDATSAEPDAIDTLIQRCLAGDQSAWDEIVRTHRRRVFNIAYKFTGKHDEAEDLTQDICLALPAKLGSWRGEARFTTWLYRVTVNAAHDRRRRAATRAKAADGWGDWEVNRRAGIAEAAAAQDWLTTAMTRLSPELRDTVALTLGEEMSQRDAAEVLGVSEGTVAWRMSEVKKRLREMARAEGML